MNGVLVDAAARRCLTHLRAAVPEMESLVRRVAESDGPVDVVAVTEAVERLTVLAEQIRTRSAAVAG